jgi:hypothetical protein
MCLPELGAALRFEIPQMVGIAFAPRMRHRFAGSVRQCPTEFTPMRCNEKCLICLGLLGLVGLAVRESSAAEPRTVVERRYVVERADSEDDAGEDVIVVRRPVVETIEREEVVTVRKPVYEMVEQEETYTVRRPVIETSQREEVYTVRKPVYETVEEERIQTVQRPIYETTEREELVTEYVPTTTCVRSYWGGGMWTDSPQTTLAQRVVARRVPVQTVRYAEERQVHRVPVQRLRYVEEQRVRKVPVKTVRYLEEQHVRKVPVERMRYIEEEEVRRVPVTVRRYTEEVRRLRRSDDDAPESTYAEELDAVDREAESTEKPRLAPKPRDSSRLVPSGQESVVATYDPADLAGPLVPLARPDRLASAR